MVFRKAGVRISKTMAESTTAMKTCKSTSTWIVIFVYHK